MTRGRDDYDHDIGDHDARNPTIDNDTDEYDTDLPRPDAVARVDELRGSELDGRGSETVGLAAISGRSSAEAIVAPADRPAHDRATMDGFAFDATGEYPFEVVSAVFPEDTPPEIEGNEAVEIATGAPLPENANAVLKREEATTENGKLRGTEIEPGTYVYRQGSNVAAGETLFERGERLSPKDAILLRDLGIEEVPVDERFSAGVLATGTEIHEGTQADFDSPMLCGLVESWGGVATYEGSVPDEKGEVEARISDLGDEYDVVITTGGTSVGKHDYALRALADLGDVLFHRVSVRPGKPIAAARLPDHDAVAFAIPGKPVGAHTIATLVMRPFFTGDAHAPTVTIEATLPRDVGIGEEGFEYAVPVTLRNNGNGDSTEAMPLGHVDSALSVYAERFDPSVLSSSTRATRADGFFLTDSGVEEGETVSVIPYTALE